MENFVLKEDAYSFVEQKWMTILYKQLEEVKTHIPFTRIAMIGIFGSQNYQLAGPFSDIDSTCLIFPSVDDLCFITKPTSFKLHSEYGDIYVKDIRSAFDELRKCSPNVLELLSSKYIYYRNIYKIYFDIMDIDYFAQLSTYKLLKGLEGLLHRYATMGFESKAYVNTIRIHQMIEKTINGVPYTQCLVPDNVEELFKMKFDEWKPEYKDKQDKLIEETLIMLSKYYETHEFTFNPQIKEDINELQRSLLLKRMESMPTF